MNRYMDDSQAEEPLFYCDRCGGEIYRGETYYIIDDKIWCEECAKKDYINAKDFQLWIEEEGYDDEYLKTLEQEHWKYTAGVDDAV